MPHGIPCHQLLGTLPLPPTRLAPSPTAEDGRVTTCCRLLYYRGPRQPPSAQQGRGGAGSRVRAASGPQSEAASSPALVYVPLSGPSRVRTSSQVGRVRGRSYGHCLGSFSAPAPPAPLPLEIPMPALSGLIRMWTFVTFSPPRQRPLHLTVCKAPGSCV